MEKYPEMKFFSHKPNFDHFQCSKKSCVLCDILKKELFTSFFFTNWKKTKDEKK